MEVSNMKRKLIAMLLAVVMVLSVVCVAACNDDKDLTTVTYNTTTSVMPSNWNEFTYADNNDTQIMNYIGSSFFEYDFLFDAAKGGKYNADGSINVDAIVSGGYTTNYSAATKLEDVTSTVDAKWGYTDEQKAKGGYAWKITLRSDLKWDDGTEIHAADFVYSMKEQLNPDFMNMRANTYYDTIRIKNSKAYFQSGAPIYTPIVPAYEDNPDYSFDISSTNVYMSTESTDMTLTGYSLATLVNSYVGTDEALAALAVIEDAANEYGYTLITDENKEAAMNLLSYALLPFGINWGSFDEATQNELFMESLFYLSGYGDEVDWNTVGMYAVDTDSFVICLDTSYAFLDDEGNLTYLAAYYMSSLPLVKQSLYEQCKQEPKVGATLWTSNYNTSLATTASWGPYKLAEFQSGKSYKLVKNENWYGYSLEQYKNQYKVDVISCECVPEANTQWLKFLAGETDDASLDSEHINDYRKSKYTTYTPGTGTFGMQLYGNKEVLALSGNNNGILAIDEFRQAFSLALNRSDIVDTIWPGTSVVCYGVMNSQYYYDVENGGVYRDTKQAKEGLLRAYGFTETNGTWSNGAEINGVSMDAAYDALTGYNPTLAKELVKKAYDILVANATEYGYDATKDITIVYGSSVDTAKQRERATYLQNVLNELCKDTALEGKIKIKFDASAGSEWADAFRNGDTQIGFGYGFSGNPFNPFDIIGSFVDPDDSLNYHTYWDTYAVDMTLTLPEGDYDGAGETLTMNLVNWFYCLNGLAEVYQEECNFEYTYDWNAGQAPADARLVILAALEEQVIKKSYSVMLIGEYSGSLLSPKFTQLTDEYNTFMGFGGIRYIQVNYNDGEWAKFVEQNGNDLTNEYKKNA